MDDRELLCAYADDGLDEAFRELVRRHGGIVYAVARRQPGVNEHLAEDITQRVFVALARKAKGLRSQTTLVGWLYQAARKEAALAVRTEARRRKREERNAAMNTPSSDESNSHDPASWEELVPVLDDAIAELNEGQRRALLLRFFSNQSYAEVGQSLRVGEEAARKRVDRAIEKLRLILHHRGIAASVGSLGATLSAHAAPALGTRMMATITQVALQQAAVGPAFALGVFMSSMKTAIVATLASVIVASSVVWFDHAHVSNVSLREAEAVKELSALTRQRDEAVQTRAQWAEEAARLQRSKAAVSLTSNLAQRTSAYLKDPSYRAAAARASKARRHLEFQRFYRQLHLGSAQISRFEDVMIQQDQANLDAQFLFNNGGDPQTVYRKSGPEWSEAMISLLGRDGFGQLETYLRGVSIRNFVDDIAAQTYADGEPISLDQADRLIALALANDPTYQQGKGTDPGKTNWNAVWEPASRFLSSQQVATFETAVEVWSLQMRLALAKKTAVDVSRP